MNTIEQKIIDLLAPLTFFNEPITKELSDKIIDIFYHSCIVIPIVDLSLADARTKLERTTIRVIESNGERLGVSADLNLNRHNVIISDNGPDVTGIIMEVESIG